MLPVKLACTAPELTVIEPVVSPVQEVPTEDAGVAVCKAVYGGATSLMLSPLKGEAPPFVA